MPTTSPARPTPAADFLAADFAAFMAQTAAPMIAALGALDAASKGGPGSGNFGHAGRPGQVGGSASGTSQPAGLPPYDPVKREAWLAYHNALNAHFYDKLTAVEHGDDLLRAVEDVAASTILGDGNAETARARFLAQFEDAPDTPVLPKPQPEKRAHAWEPASVPSVLWAIAKIVKADPQRTAVEAPELERVLNLPSGVRGETVLETSYNALRHAVQWEHRANLNQWRIKGAYRFDSRAGIVSAPQALRQALHQAGYRTPRALLREAEALNPAPVATKAALPVIVIDSDENADWLQHTPGWDGDLVGADAVKGGSGSGNFGHAGRPGLVGGSAPADSSPAGRATKPTKPATETPTANPFVITDARGIEWRTDRKCDPAVVDDTRRLVDSYPDWAVSEIKRIRLCGRPGKAFTAGGQTFATAAEFTASTKDIALYNANERTLDYAPLLDHELGHSLETAIGVYAQRGRAFASTVAQTTGQARATMEQGRDDYAPWVKVADALDAARAKQEDGVSAYSKAWWQEGEHQGQAETLAVLTTHYFGSAPGARGKTPADRVRNACRGQAEGLGEAFLAGLALLEATYQTRGKKSAPAPFPPPIAAALRAAIGAWQSTQATKAAAPTVDNVLVAMAQDAASFTDYAARLGLPGDHQAIVRQLFNQEEATQ